MENLKQTSKLLALAQTGSLLIQSNPAHTNPTIAEFLSFVLATDTLLQTFDFTLSRYSKTVHCDTAFIGALCECIEGSYEEVRVLIEDIDAKKKVDVLNGEKICGLRKRLVEGRDKVQVLIDGVKVVALRKLGKEGRTKEEEEELAVLIKILPSIVEKMIPLQREYAAHLSVQSSDEKEVVMDLSMEQKDTEVPDLSEDVEDLKKIKIETTIKTSASCGSSVTVIDDSIEEAWLLRRNEPKNILKGSNELFGIKLFTWYKHEAASYYVKPLQTSKLDVKELHEMARGRSTEAEHQVDLKKMILALEDKAQWEIQKLIEARGQASSNDTVKREWEVVAFQTRPRRKISAPIKKNWWKKGKEPLVEWAMVLHGGTIDHQKRVTPVKHEDPWKKKVEERTDTSVKTEKSTPMTQDDAKEKMDGVLTSFFRPVVGSSVDGKGDD